MGERWGTRCFPAFSRCSLPHKTQENSRRMAENVCEFFVLPLENTRKHQKTRCSVTGKRRLTTEYDSFVGSVNTSKTSVFRVLTEPENYWIIERILEFTGKKTTEKEWTLRPENAREFKQNAAFSKINRGFSVTVNTIFLAVGVLA